MPVLAVAGFSILPRFLFPFWRKQKGLTFAPCLMFSLNLESSSSRRRVASEKTSAPTQTWGTCVTPTGASQAQGPSATRLK